MLDSPLCRQREEYEVPIDWDVYTHRTTTPRTYIIIRNDWNQHNEECTDRKNNCTKIAWKAFSLFSNNHAAFAIYIIMVELRQYLTL